jgi:flagellar protein FlgJ
MAISPPSDIVLDVARAADPTRYQTASKRLSELSSTSNASEFADVFKGTASRSFNPLSLDPYTVKTTNRNETALSGADKTNSAYEQFEAFVLQSFVESILPKESEAVFGKGTAGGIWKSMLAEQIGTQIAKAGGVGIAKKVLAAHPLPHQEAQQRLVDTTGEVGVHSEDDK